MENGDQGEHSFHGTAVMKDATIQTAEDSWTLVHGTGKLKGAKGRDVQRVLGLRMAPSPGNATANTPLPVSRRLQASTRAARAALFVFHPASEQVGLTLSVQR
jgi:hypothetical protein